MAPIALLRTYTQTPIAKEFALLFGAQLLTAVAGLLLGKATASYMPPAELGDYNLLLSGLTLGHVVLIVPILQSFKAEQARVGVEAALSVHRRLLGWAYVGLVGGLLLAGYVAHALPVALLMGMAVVGQGVQSGSLDYLNLTGQQRRYAGFQVGYALTNLLLFCIWVIYADQPTMLALWGCLATANVLFAGLSLRAATLSRTATTARPTTDQPNWRRFWSYARPLVALAGWGWVINYGDRYLISLYLSEADVGQYSVGYGLGAKLILLVSPFVVHSSRRVYALRAVNTPLRAVWLVQRAYLLTYAGLGGLACFVFYIFRQPLGLLLLSPTYETAFTIGPIVATGYLLLTLIHLLEVQWYAYGLTKLVLWNSIAGAIANVSFNLLLIPRFGLIGSAYAALLGFFVQLITAGLLYAWNLRTPSPTR